MSHLPALLGLLITSLLTSSVYAQSSVTLSGVLGKKALLIVDGAPPKTVAAGQTYAGITVISVKKNQAILEYAGSQHTLNVGDAPSRAINEQTVSRIVLTASNDGHFFTNGQINGQNIKWMVDTGATNVSISKKDADRLKLHYHMGKQISINTANGVTQGWQFKMRSLQIGEVTVYDVDVVVTPSDMPFGLLGNSFLSQFEMTRTGNQMVLKKRH